MLDDRLQPYPVYFSKAIKSIERACAHLPLMERAGRHAAEFIRGQLPPPAQVLVLAGPGNNGGDGLVAARYLRSWNYSVEVVLCGDPTKAPPDALEARSRWQAQGGQLLHHMPDRPAWDCILDGLFGIGLDRDLSAQYLSLIEQVNDQKGLVIALDIPSGVNADTGQLQGGAIRADHTLSFIALKPGLLTADGLDYVGRVHPVPLGIAPVVLQQPSGWTLGQRSVTALLPPRKLNSNKGQYGRVAVLGGAAGMTGAAILAGRAALKVGAGRVYVAQMAEQSPALDLLQPELMWRPPAELLEISGMTWVAGPGLGHSEAAARYLAAALALDQSLLLDADALNNIATDAGLQQAVCARKAATLLTPHPLEAARLLGREVADIQQDRIRSAITLAQRYGSTVVLKGAGSVIAQPSGAWWINPTGNAGLSSAGTGDVLSGMIGALLAQGLGDVSAAQLGVFVHGAAAEWLSRRGNGPVGLTASEVMDAGRRLLNQWQSGAA